MSLSEIDAVFQLNTADLQGLISGMQAEMDLGLSKDVEQR